jgi:uracil-DNA glycosylase family 4
MSVAAEELAALAASLSGCTRCKLAGLGRTQVVVGRGDPDADLVFVGEGPGAEEDKQGLPFVGRSGQLLDRLAAEEMGLARHQFYVANVVKCRPPGNRDPEPDEIATCRPFLERQIEIMRPAVIVTLGNFATKLLLDTREGITRLRGRVYPYAGGTGEQTLVPTFHPAAVLRGGADQMAQMRADFVRAKQALPAVVAGPAAPEAS